MLVKQQLLRVYYSIQETHKIGETHEGDHNGLDGSRTRKRYNNYFCLHNLFTGKVIELNIIDTPGHVTSQLKLKDHLRVLDGAVALY